MAMDQYLYIPFLVGWTSIYQLFWCELQGDRVLTHPHIYTTSLCKSICVVFYTCIHDMNIYDNICIHTVDTSSSTGTETVAPNSLDPRLHLSELVPRKIHGKTMAFPMRIPWKTMGKPWKTMENHGKTHGISDFTWLPRGFQVWKWR